MSAFSFGVFFTSFSTFVRRSGSAPKWLKESPHRYGELRSRIPGLADKMLTQRLKQLESLGLIAKTHAGKTAAGRAYKLTARGESLRPVLGALYEWGEAMAAELNVAIPPRT